ncbi:MAG: sulfotransferase family protein [Planctomycetota bacterium]
MHQPFFILGTARCGSSRLWQILEAHPQVCLTNEGRIVDALYFFARYARTPKGQRLHHLLDEETDLRGIVPAEHVDAFSALIRRHAPTLLTDFYARLANDPAVTHWGDKLPDPEAAHAVQAILPQTRFLVLVRDPRDAWASWRRYRERPGVAEDFPAAAAIDVDAFAHNWSNLYAATDRYFEHAMTVRYEDLVAETHATTTRILAHLGLPADPAVTAAVDDKARLRGHATITSTERSVGSWQDQIPATEIARILEICAAGMQLHGYA